MATIDDLRKEIEHEKKKSLYNSEIEEQGNERARLEKELKDLRFKNKFGKAHETGKKVFGNVKQAFGELQKGVAKLQSNQNQKDRENKAIRKRGFSAFAERKGINEKRGIFG